MAKTLVSDTSGSNWFSLKTVPGLDTGTFFVGTNEFKWQRKYLYWYDFEGKTYRVVEDQRLQKIQELYDNLSKAAGPEIPEDKWRVLLNELEK